MQQLGCKIITAFSNSGLCLNLWKSLIARFCFAVRFDFITVLLVMKGFVLFETPSGKIAKKSLL